MGFREKILIFGVLPWLVALVVIVLLTIPTVFGTFDKLSDLNTKEQELQVLKDQVKQKSNTTKLKSGILEIKQAIKGFNLQFPQEENMDTMYVDFENAAKESQVVISKISVAKDKKYKFPKDFFSKDSGNKKDKKDKKKSSKAKKESDPFIVISRIIKLEMIGSYQSIVDMLYYLSNYYRFISFSDIQLKIADKDNKKIQLPFLSSSGTNINATITFEIYKINKYVPVVDEDSEKSKKKKNKGNDS